MVVDNLVSEVPEASSAAIIKIPERFTKSTKLFSLKSLINCTKPSNNNINTK